MHNARLLPMVLVMLPFFAGNAGAFSAHVEAAREAINDATTAPENRELFCAFLGTFGVDDSDDSALSRETEMRRQFLASAMGPAFSNAWELTTKTPADQMEELTEVLAEFDQQCASGTEDSAVQH